MCRKRMESLQQMKILQTKRAITSKIVHSHTLHHSLHELQDLLNLSTKTDDVNTATDEIFMSAHVVAHGVFDKTVS